MNLLSAFSLAFDKLEGSYCFHEMLYRVDTILSCALRRSEDFLHSNLEYELAADEEALFLKYLELCSQWYPIEYITGTQVFRGLNLSIRKDVFIPRLYNEKLIDVALDLLGTASTDADEMGLRAVADVGTGTGALALALVNELPDVCAIGVDISECAVTSARFNAARLRLRDRAKFIRSDLLAEVKERNAFDLVISDVPYLRSGLQYNGFEPRIALFGGEDGLDFIRRLIPEARRHLKPGGWLVMTHGKDQRIDVQALLADWKDARYVRCHTAEPGIFVASNPD